MPTSVPTPFYYGRQLGNNVLINLWFFIEKVYTVYSLKNLYFSFQKTTEHIHKLLCISETISSIVYELNWWLFDL